MKARVALSVVLASMVLSGCDSDWRYGASSDKKVSSVQSQARSGGVYLCSDDPNEIELCDANGNEILDIDFDQSKKSSYPVYRPQSSLMSTGLAIAPKPVPQKAPAAKSSVAIDKPLAKPNTAPLSIAPAGSSNTSASGIKLAKAEPSVAKPAVKPSLAKTVSPVTAKPVLAKPVVSKVVPPVSKAVKPTPRKVTPTRSTSSGYSSSRSSANSSRSSYSSRR